MRNKNLLDYFEETVGKYPQKVAAIHGVAELTFSDLQEKSLELADYIAETVQSTGCWPVCVFLPKSLDVVISDIAAIYSGNFFNNLDVKTPGDRIQNILQMLNPVAVITNDKYISV